MTCPPSGFGFDLPDCCTGCADDLHLYWCMDGGWRKIVSSLVGLLLHCISYWGGNDQRQRRDSPPVVRRTAQKNNLDFLWIQYFGQGSNAGCPVKIGFKWRTPEVIEKARKGQCHQIETDFLYQLQRERRVTGSSNSRQTRKSLSK